jgi:hypothetical protein
MEVSQVTKKKKKVFELYLRMKERMSFQKKKKRIKRERDIGR